MKFPEFQRLSQSMLFYLYVCHHYILSQGILGANSFELYRHETRNLSSPIKTNLHFSLSRSGLISIDIVEFSEWIEVPVKNTTLTKPGKSDARPESDGNSNQTLDGTSTEASNITELIDATTGVENVTITEKKLRKRTIRVPLKVFLLI